MRLALALIFLLFLGTFAPRSLYREPVLPERSFVRFTPVNLNKSDPGHWDVGKLRYLGGWELTSNDPRFGSISAMHMGGSRVTAISDRGHLFRFALRPDRKVPLSIRLLEEGPGPKEIKFNRDSEAMAVHGRSAWIAYEWRNGIWRYSADTWRGQSGARPLPMRRWKRNNGAEAMVRLSDGRFLIFSEGDGEGPSEALLFESDPAAASARYVRLTYRPPEGYRITDAVALPGGALLFLNRSFSLLQGLAFSTKITYAAAPNLSAGSVLSGSEIASFDSSPLADNHEALSVTYENGRTILWMASDHNFVALQRTLLLKFELRVP